MLCLAPLAPSLRELSARDGAVGDQALGALTGLRRLSLDRCEGVSVDAVRGLPMLRHLDVALAATKACPDAFTSWRQMMGHNGEAALRAGMRQLEHVRVTSLE